MPQVSIRSICPALEVSRSAVARENAFPQATPSRLPLGAFLVEPIRELIQKHPTYGYRRLWALLRFREGLLMNKKTVYRILRVKKWFLHERRSTPRPRVKGRASIAARSADVRLRADAQALVMMDLPVGWRSGWQPSPRKQWVVCLAGEIGYKARSGAEFTLTPGSCILNTDTRDEGHNSWNTGTEPVRLALVQVP